MFQLVLKASSAAVALCALCSGVATAQTSNGIPVIVHRIYRYSGHAQPLGGTAANLPPPPPSEDDIPLSMQDELKINKQMKRQQNDTPTMMPQRRPELKKDRDKDKDNDPIKSLFVVDGATTNKTDPEIKKWGWLAEEADANRQVLESYRKPNPEAEASTNSLARRSDTNETRRAQFGSLKSNAYEPMGTERSQTATSQVARVVQDHIAREAEQRKQEDTKEKNAQKDSVNLAEKRELPPVMTATNETLGLARSHKDDERADSTLDTDYAQTRKALAGITDRYQLNLTMADLIRRPGAPPPDANGGKTLASRYTAEREGTAGFAGDARRASTTGDEAGGVRQPASRAPTTATAAQNESGASWIKPPAGSAPPVRSASAMVEGPKAPKAADMQASATFAPPAPAPSTTTSYTPQPSYTPASTLPRYYTPGGHSSGSTLPAFKPTAPYKSLFDSPSSR